MFFFLRNLLVILFIVSLLGYIFIVLIEKKHIKQNIILIDNKHLSENDIKEVDIRKFVFMGERLCSGDEIKITTKNNKAFNGTIIGAKSANKAIHIITYNNQISKFKIDNILKLKVISRYGKFFNV